MTFKIMCHWHFFGSTPKLGEKVRKPTFVENLLSARHFPKLILSNSQTNHQRLMMDSLCLIPLCTAIPLYWNIIHPEHFLTRFSYKVIETTLYSSKRWSRDCWGWDWKPFYDGWDVTLEACQVALPWGSTKTSGKELVQGTENPYP